MRLPAFHKIVEKICDKLQQDQYILPDSDHFETPLCTTLTQACINKKINKKQGEQLIEDLLREKIPTWLEIIKKIEAAYHLSSNIEDLECYSKLVREGAARFQELLDQSSQAKSKVVSPAKPAPTKPTLAKLDDKRRIHDSTRHVRVADSLSRLLLTKDNPCTAVTILTPAHLSYSESSEITQPTLFVAINSRNSSKKQSRAPKPAVVTEVINNKLQLIKDFITVVLENEQRTGTRMSKEAKKKLAREYVAKIIQLDGGVHEAQEARLIQDLLKVTHRTLLPLKVEVIVPKDSDSPKNKGIQTKAQLHILHAEQVILRRVQDLAKAGELTTKPIIIGISKLCCGDCNDVLGNHRHDGLESEVVTIQHRGTHSYYFARTDRLDGSPCPTSDKDYGIITQDANDSGTEIDEGDYVLGMFPDSPVVPTSKVQSFQEPLSPVQNMLSFGKVFSKLTTTTPTLSQDSRTTPALQDQSQVASKTLT